ncbi:MAG TPA: hypothetical protein H9929_01240 [Candidatus Alistipes excrementavium]|nr:hypothetical protein [Candidatus Alistipes excrementavium]
MKTILFTFALPLALCAAHGATAQIKSTMSAPKADSVMLSETTDGDYLVRRYMVRSDADTGYTVRYKISSSTLTTNFDGNPSEIQGLTDFINSMDRDSLMQVKSVTITGYASPDGPLALNERLAKNRAQSLKNYVDEQFGLSKKYDVRTASVASDWDAAREAIARSNVPDKQTVLGIIDRRGGRTAVEQRLKALPAEVWKYLADRILPPMRYAEIAIAYVGGREVVQRTLIPKPEVVVVEEVEEVCCDPCACVEVMESVNGLIVEMPDVPVDF